MAHFEPKINIKFLEGHLSTAPRTSRLWRSPVHKILNTPLNAMV